MNYILYAFLPIVMHSIKLCAWLFLCIVVLEWVFGIFALCSCIFVHRSFTLHFILCGYLSLLPSFSLSLEHFPMAPKKSTTPICNLVSHASSSFSPVLDSLQFNDKNCWKAFKENFTLHRPHVEHQIILSELSNTAIPKTFQSCGLEFLCERLTTCLVVYVQEFYSNIYIVGTSVPMFTTSVQGTCISMTPELISELVHVGGWVWPP